jgi:hypothetical protein
MPKNPFLKYVMKDKKEDVFHSSTYAKAQNGGNMGTASAESFAVRVKINNNRKMVGNYSSSRIASGTVNRVPKATTPTPKAVSTTPVMPKTPSVSTKK